MSTLLQFHISIFLPINETIMIIYRVIQSKNTKTNCNTNCKENETISFAHTALSTTRIYFVIKAVKIYFYSVLYPSVIKFFHVVIQYIFIY